MQLRGVEDRGAARPDQQIGPRPLLDLLHSSTNFRTQFKTIFRDIQALGALTTQYLDRCEQEDAEYNESSMESDPHTFLEAPLEMEKVKRTFETWRLIFVTNTETMRELRHYKLKDGRTIKDVLAMHVFVELTRLYQLVYRPVLLREMNNLATTAEEDLNTDDYVHFVSLVRSTKHTMWLSIVNSFDPEVEAAATAAAAALEPKKKSKPGEKKEEPPPVDEDVVAAALLIKGIWSKNVMEYRQSEVRLMIMFLTQQVNELPTEDNGVVREYRLIFNTLWIRLGQLISNMHPETVLDLPDMRSNQNLNAGVPLPNCFTVNREFCTFCSLYMGELVRRFMHYDSIIGNRLNVESRVRLHIAVSAREWVTKAVMGFATSAFETMYRSVIEDGYNYPGDDAWFKFKWDKKVHSRAACITEFRPHLHGRFFSEAQLNRQTILNAAAGSSNLVARLFVLKAIDEIIKQTCPSIPAWQAAFVVFSNGIELATYKLISEKVPLIVQFLSSFWVYEKGRVHVCDNIFEAFGVWAWIIHTRYGDKVYESRVAELMREIFGAGGGQRLRAAPEAAAPQAPVQSVWTPPAGQGQFKFD